MANLVAPGEPAVVASCGKFGERWAELCDAYGADTHRVDFEWGEKVDPAALDEALAALERPPRGVFTTQSETSTGVVNDIRALNEVATGRDRCSASTRSPGSAPSTCRRTSGGWTWSSPARRSR